MGLVEDAKRAYENVSGQGSYLGDTRPVATTVSNAKVVVWHYVVQNFGSSSGVDIISGEAFDAARSVLGSNSIKKNYLTSMPASDEDVFKVERLILDAEIAELQTSKSIGSPSGNFRISLLASSNWKKKIAPGDWLAIYLFQGENSFDADNLDSRGMVMLGTVDRIAKTKQRDEDTDKVVVRYVISGRDFGKVFEDVVAWFNPYAQKEDMVSLILTTAGMKFAGNPSQIVGDMVKLFFGGNLGQYNLANGKKDKIKQALIPAEIEDLIGNRFSVSELYNRQNAELPDKKSPTPGPYDPDYQYETFDGGVLFSTLIRMNLDENLPGFKPVATVAQAAAGMSVWSLMKRESNSLVNDLYVDLSKDENGYCFPTLSLAPHPCSNFFEDTPGALNDTCLQLNDLDEISISNSKIKYEDLGRDDNSRVNMIWLEALQGTSKLLQTAAYIGHGGSNGIGLPMYQRESIMRHGLKIWDQMLENAYIASNKNYDVSASATKAKASGLRTDLSTELYNSFINLIYDLNIYNHLYETGSIVTTGDPLAQIGSCLRIKSDFDDDDRLFFIEGYSHTWTYPNQWETEWNLTHGQFDNKVNPFIDARDADGGQDDIETNKRYLVKTNLKKP